MKKRKLLHQPITMAFLFVLFVIVPGIVLSLIGVRSLSRENAFLEKQITTALLIETKPIVAAMEEQLDSIQSELDSLFHVEPIYQQLVQQQISNQEPEFIPEDSQVLFTYQLSSTFDIVSPKFQGDLSEEQKRFFRFNRDFFQDRVPVAVYKRVEIKEKPTYSQSSKGSYSKDIYASIKGSSSRNVEQKKAPSKRYRNEVEYQVKTQESLRFSQIIENKESGIILREIDGELMLLYFRKSESGDIKGAVVDLEKVQQRLLATIDKDQTSQRLLVLEDQNEQPINPRLQPQGEPLVELSIGKYLPVWHLSAYLTDPEMINRQAELNGTVIGLMIVLLMVSLTIGGIIIIRTIVLQLREAEQKTTFVANVSHELKTPLTSIRLFAELLQQRRQNDPEKQQKYLSIMVSESERLTRLINNVLDFSRGNRGEKQYHFREIDLTETVSELIEHQRIRLEHQRFTVETALPKEPVILSVDPEAIKQVILNLISNAEKYSNGGKWIGVFFETTDNSAVIAVEDRGIGIDPKLRKRVFQEFFRVDTSLTAPVQGTGLGLTISRTIIRDHGGDILCSEGSEGGSRFTITLPLRR